MEKVVGLVDKSTSSRTGVINWPTQEDGKGNVVIDIVNLPILADAAALVHSLRDAASYWRSQERKALWLMLPIEYCKNFLPPAFKVGFSIHQVCPTYFMLVLTLGDDESHSLLKNDVNQFEGGLHFSTNDILEKNVAEQYYSFSMLPQWQTRGHRNPEAAEIGGTSAENNALSQPLELVVNLAPSSMIDLGSNSQADALLRCIARPSTWAPQQPGSEEPATRTTSKRRFDTSQHNLAQQTKRRRGPNWTRDQKLYLLTHMLNYKLRQKQAEGEPGDWFHSASKSYLDKYGIMIEPGKWQDQMDSLLKQFKAIRAYECKIQSGKSNCVSFWKLSEGERSDASKSLKQKISISFDQEMFQLVEKIHQIQKKNKQETSRGSRQVQVRELRQSSSNLHMDSTISESAGASDGNRSSHHVLPFSDMDSLEGFEGETVGLDVGNMLRRSSASGTVDEVPELIAKIGPFVHQLIEFALQPLHFAMRKREEDEENYRMKMLSTQAHQLAVMRQEIELTRNGVFASTYGLPIGGMNSIVSPIMEHGQPDALRSYHPDEEPEEGFANFDWTDNPL